MWWYHCHYLWWQNSHCLKPSIVYFHDIYIINSLVPKVAKYLTPEILHSVMRLSSILKLHPTPGKCSGTLVQDFCSCLSRIISLESTINTLASESMETLEIITEWFPKIGSYIRGWQTLLCGLVPVSREILTVKTLANFRRMKNTSASLLRKQTGL